METETKRERERGGVIEIKIYATDVSHLLYKITLQNLSNIDPGVEISVFGEACGSCPFFYLNLYLKLR